MKTKTKSILFSTMLYLMLILMWGGMLVCYAMVILLSDVIKYFGDGALLISFGVVTLLCFIIPIIFRKKLKLRLPILLIIFSLLSAFVNATTTVGSCIYLSHYTPEKWDKHRELRYCMTDSLESQYNIVGKTEQEITELLGEPENIANQFDYRYEYFIGYGMIDPYTYDIIFEDGVAIRAEINEH